MLEGVGRVGPVGVGVAGRVGQCCKVGVGWRAWWGCWWLVMPGMGQLQGTFIQPKRVYVTA